MSELTDRFGFEKPTETDAYNNVGSIYLNWIEEKTALKTDILEINEQTLEYVESNRLVKLTSKEKVSTALGRIAKVVLTFIDYYGNQSSHITSDERDNKYFIVIETGTAECNGIIERKYMNKVYLSMRWKSGKYR